MNTIVLYCALDKEIQEYQDNIIREIATKFNLNKIIDLNVEPHFTLKYHITITGEQLDFLENIISDFCANNLKTKIKVGGYTSFPPSVTFTHVKFSKEAKLVFFHLIDLLRSIDWITWSPFDAENMHFHATVADECGEKFEEVLHYLQGKEKHFDTWFDNISIIKKIGEKDNVESWKVYRKFIFAKE